ncbi:hypothetical protein C5167_021619 [Papaver somniferum]|nr:hypothetical protein C5167_021619 [Papaver somniferum]
MEGVEEEEKDGGSSVCYPTSGVLQIVANQFRPTEFIVSVKNFITKVENAAISKISAMIDTETTTATWNPPTDPGQFIGAKGMQSSGSDEEQGEAIAALEAIKWALQKGIQDLHLEGDNLNVIESINGALGRINWRTNSVIQDCRSLLSGFVNWMCTHVKRDANGVADKIAKNTRTQSMDVWYTNAP